ncbi:MAG: Type IV-A pilus assembly ATPase PilB [Parcubacteria group bacterium GW2011_GWA2_39_18]|nr:MAG: Type IV-A pilus assembly ATPase PilB [Parcubacteria group bacterium GW2011_GWA2_39_18]
MIKESNFLNYLVNQGKLSEANLKLANEEASKNNHNVEDVLIEKKYLSEQELYQLKADFLNLELRFFSETDTIPFDILNLVPQEAAVQYKFIPFNRTDVYLQAGMVHPEDFKSQEALHFIATRLGLKVEALLITPQSFNNALKQYQTLTGEVSTALEKITSELKDEEVVDFQESEKQRDVSLVLEEAPITKVVGVVLKHAVEGGASDIHIEPFQDRIRVRFRVDGVLSTSLFLPKDVLLHIVSRIKILSGLQIDETRKPQDGRFRTKINSREIDFRVSVFPTSKGEKVAIRVLDPLVGISTFPELGLQGRNAKKVLDGLQKPFGLIINTGPTGSGKSTTLYAMMLKLNQEGINIVSLEDPVEYLLEGVNQSQVRPELGYDFASGLRSILRQDPDIIMLGEVRDRETAGLVVHAALTGHIVLSTLHTNNAIGAIPRLIDMGVEPFLIPSSLTMVLAQRLVKRLCNYCKVPVKPIGEPKDLIEEAIAVFSAEELKEFSIDAHQIFESKGCKKCAGKGTKGRVAIYEILMMTPQLEEIILTEPSASKIEAEAKRQGMISMRHDGIIKALQGQVSLEEVIRAVEE